MIDKRNYLYTSHPSFVLYQYRILPSIFDFRQHHQRTTDIENSHNFSIHFSTSPRHQSPDSFMICIYFIHFLHFFVRYLFLFIIHFYSLLLPNLPDFLTIYCIGLIEHTVPLILHWAWQTYLPGRIWGSVRGRIALPYVSCLSGKSWSSSRIQEYEQLSLVFAEHSTCSSSFDGIRRKVVLEKSGSITKKICSWLATWIFANRSFNHKYRSIPNYRFRTKETWWPGSPQFVCACHMHTGLFVFICCW